MIGKLWTGELAAGHFSLMATVSTFCIRCQERG